MKEVSKIAIERVQTKREAERTNEIHKQKEAIALTSRRLEAAKATIAHAEKQLTRPIDTPKVSQKLLAENTRQYLMELPGTDEEFAARASRDTVAHLFGSRSLSSREEFVDRIAGLPETSTLEAEVKTALYVVVDKLWKPYQEYKESLSAKSEAILEVEMCQALIQDAENRLRVLQAASRREQFPLHLRLDQAYQLRFPAGSHLTESTSRSSGFKTIYSILRIRVGLVQMMACTIHQDDHPDLKGASSWPPSGSIRSIILFFRSSIILFHIK